jgi:hypothetical protein
MLGMTAEEFFIDFYKQTTARGVEEPHITEAILRLQDEAKKPAYFRSPGNITRDWATVRAFGISKGLFVRYRGNDKAKRALEVFLDVNRPKKSSRERKWNESHRAGR